VLSPPEITGQPQGLTVTNGGPASFGVTVSGTDLVYQWQKNGTDLTDGGALSGSATTNLLLSLTTTNDAGSYTVIITNAWGSVTSSVAILTVLSPPVIAQQPANQTVVVGGTASFSVTADGTAPLSYQWNCNGTNISGATNTSLILNNVQPSQSGTYAALVTNLVGSILSSNAVLTITLDHFTWGQIPSPRFVNTPFSVTIQARDMTDGIFTNFIGIAFLDSANGVAVSPALSGNFIQGCWTGVVVISQAATNLVLRAGDGLGHFGLANPINVVALPPLNLQISGNTLLLRWPAGYSGVVLETSAAFRRRLGRWCRFLQSRLAANTSFRSDLEPMASIACDSPANKQRTLPVWPIVDMHAQHRRASLETKSAPKRRRPIHWHHCADFRCPPGVAGGKIISPAASPKLSTARSHGH